MIGIAILLIYRGSPDPMPWLIYISTAALFYGVAAGFDALYDSLFERINIQSSWLDVRLAVLERAAGARSGQDIWRADGVPTSDLSHYYESYPEHIR
jgi:hypothetical protein